MESNTTVKVLILIVCLSYFSYAVYWFMKGSFWMAETILNPGYYIPPMGFRFVDSSSLFAANLMDYGAFLGLIARVIGGFYAVLSACILFRNQSNSFLALKGKLSVILLCEATYFLSFVPSIIFLVGFSALPFLSNVLLSAQLIIQVTLIVPCLIMLTLKIRKAEKDANGSQSVIKWTAFLFLNYLFALWVSYLLKWFELLNGAQVTLSTTLSWLIENARLLSFLNTVFIFTLAVIFAIVGAKCMIDTKKNNAVRYWSLSAFFVGLFFVFYILYCVYLGVFWVIPFGELWLIPLLFVGIYFLVLSLEKKWLFKE